jgi:hypothetical protein
VQMTEFHSLSYNELLPDKAMEVMDDMHEGVARMFSKRAIQNVCL